MTELLGKLQRSFELRVKGSVLRAGEIEGGGRSCLGVMKLNEDRLTFPVF